MSLISICAPAQMWKEGTEVERDIDGCWFMAVVLSFERGGTFTVRWTGLYSQRLHSCACVCCALGQRTFFLPSLNPKFVPASSGFATTTT